MSAAYFWCPFRVKISSARSHWHAKNDSLTHFSFYLKHSPPLSARQDVSRWPLAYAEPQDPAGLWTFRKLVFCVQPSFRWSYHAFRKLRGLALLQALVVVWTWAKNSNKRSYPGYPLYIEDITWVLLFYWIYLTGWGKEIVSEACLAFYLFFLACLINSIKQEHEC